MAKRYEIRSRDYLTGTGGTGGKVKKEVFVVWDTLRRQVAQGTSGEKSRPGGYATRKDADRVRATLEREHQANLKAAKERKKRENS